MLQGRKKAEHTFHLRIFAVKKGRFAGSKNLNDFFQNLNDFFKFGNDFFSAGATFFLRCGSKWQKTIFFLQKAREIEKKCVSLQSETTTN